MAARCGVPPCPVPPLAAGGQLGCWAPLSFLPLVRSFKPGRTMCIRSVNSMPLSPRLHPQASGLRPARARCGAICEATLSLCPPSLPPSPCPAPLPWLQGLWPSVSPSPSSLYLPGVHCTEQCARQPSHSLVTIQPPGVLVSRQVARTLHCTRLRPLSLVPTFSRCMTLRRHVAHCTSGGGLPSGSTLRRPAVSSAPARRGWPARLLGTLVVLAPGPLIQTGAYYVHKVREQHASVPSSPPPSLCPPASASTVRSNLRGNPPSPLPFCAPAPWPSPAPCVPVLPRPPLPLFPGFWVSGLLSPCPRPPFTPRRALCRAICEASLPLPLHLSAPLCPGLLASCTQVAPHPPAALFPLRPHCLPLPPLPFSPSDTVQDTV